MAKVVEYRLSMGPHIVAVGGGTGLTLLLGLKSFTRNITAVVAVTDVEEVPAVCGRNGAFSPRGCSKLYCCPGRK